MAPPGHVCLRLIGKHHRNIHPIYNSKQEVEPHTLLFRTSDTREHSKKNFIH